MRSSQIVVVTLLFILTGRVNGTSVVDVLYRNTPLTRNPGIYYELIDDLQLIHTQWQVTVTLDCRRLNDPVTWRENQLLQMTSSCAEMLSEKECKNLIPHDKFTQDFKLIKTLRQDLTVFFLPAMSSSVHLQRRAPHSISKRAPFEFMGWGTRQLFGIMDAEDRTHINNEIENLYERTANISLLAANQTHIIKSSLDAVHEQLEKDREFTYQSHRFAMSLLNKTGQLANHTFALQGLSRWIYQFEQSLDYTINSYKTLINAVESTARGHLHPLLLNTEQFKLLLQEINTAKPAHTMPWGTNNVTPDQLYSLSRTSVVTHNGRLVVNLKFPLSDGVKYTNYRLHSLAVPKELYENGTGYMRIVPGYTNLIISHDLQYYALVNAEFFTSCKSYQSVLLCPPSVVFERDSITSPCEFAMLVRPNVKNLKDCQISMSLVNKPRWIKLVSTDEWLYSTKNPVGIRVICADGRKGDLTIQGIGILSIQGQCNGHTSQHILYGVNVISASQAYTYTPDMSFNLTFVMPENKGNAMVVPEFQNEEISQIKNWAESENAISLRQVENRFREIAHQRHSHYQNIVYTSSAISGPIIIVVILWLCYKCRKNIRCLAFRERRSSKNKNKTINEEKGNNSLQVEIPLMDRTTVPMTGRYHQGCNPQNVVKPGNSIQLREIPSVICIPRQDLTLGQDSNPTNVPAIEYLPSRFTSTTSLNSVVRELPIQGIHV